MLPVRIKYFLLIKTNCQNFTPSKFETKIRIRIIRHIKCSILPKVPESLINDFTLLRKISIDKIFTKVCYNYFYLKSSTTKSQTPIERPNPATNSIFYIWKFLDLKFWQSSLRKNSCLA